MSADNNKQSAAFETLLGELDILTKALPAADVADDKKIQAAADGNGDADDENKDDQDGGAPMTKSLTVTLPNGETIEAEDGTELVKSLMDQVGKQEDMMVKAMGGVVSLVKHQGEQLKAQGDLIKSLQDTVTRLSGQGAGRKSIVDVHQQVTELTKSFGGQQEKGINPVEIMAKSNAAFSAGKISGQELNTIDVSLRMGAAIEPSLLAKVG
jgi:hypothetical protein